jgi:uncharacterized protein YggT (Ycf19 family)
MRYKHVNVLVSAIRFVFGLAETILFLRFFLKLLSASPGAAFVRWVYATSEPLLAPFQNMFPAPMLEGGLVIEFTTLFAILAYGILAYLLEEFIFLIAHSVDNRK